MHRFRLVALFAHLFVATLLTAQEPWLDAPFTSKPADLLAAAAKIEAEGSDVVVLFDDNRISFDIEGRATRTYYMVFKVLTAQGAEDWADVSAHYSPWREHKPVIRARVVTADGAVHTPDPKTFADAPVRSDSPTIYTDDRRLAGPLPAIAAGAVVEQEVSIAESRSMLDFGYIYRVRFGGSVPIQFTRMVIEAPAKLTLREAVQLLPGLVRDRKEADGKVTITLTHGRLETLEGPEPYAPGDVPAYPQVAVSTGSSWQALASHYSRLVDEKIKDGDVRAFVEKAKSGKDREAVVASLFRQLHETVRYTGVEFAEASIIPQPPSETLKRKYGDCKDKSTLLVAMLRAAGIPAHLALLSTGPGEDSPRDLPGLGVFDHAIVYVPGSPEYWIDATAELSRLDQFPTADQGRLALIVAPESTALVTTPEPPSSSNRLVVVRDVHLAEKGPARFIEVTHPGGPLEASYRSYYQGGDQKERRKNLEDYVKNEYSSDRLVRFESTNARDFSTPFKLTLEAAEARRGFTSLYHADLHVTIYNILYRLPDYLLKDPAEAEGQEEKLISERDKKKRRNEFVFDQPHVTEWQYRIHPPPGFVVRAVPEDQVERFGPATLTTRFARDLKDGVLLGSFVFDSGKRRWSAADVEAFRDALKKWKKVDNPQVSFSLKGTMLLQAGKVREGLDELKRLSALHPKESLHHVQIAYSLLEAGLGSGARAEARLATQLEPTSAEAHRALGWILQHDLVGRRRKKGFDLPGAVAAYRKALELDPKNNEIRLDYAILLEYDARGHRYSAEADLAEALKQYEAIGDKLSEYNAVDNPLYTRLYLRKYDELIKELNSIQRNDARRALLLTALAAGQGPAAAIAEANKLASQGGSRARVLASSAQQLTNLRLYPEASDLLAAAAEGSDKAASELSRARVFRNAVRFDPSRLQPDDPANAVRLFLARLMDDSEPTDEFLESFASPDLIAIDPSVRRKELVRSREVVIATRNTLRRSGSDLAVLRDITMSIGQLTAESDGVDTHRVRYSTPGSRAQTFFVSRINGRLYVTGSSNSFDGVALVLLRRIAAGDLESTRKVFDWIREDVKVGGGEDELEGPVFPRLWTRGQQTNAAEARIVAAALITETRTEVAIPILEQALAGDSVPEARRPFVRLALARAYEKAARYSDLARLLPSLRTAYPDSLTVFNVSATAFQATRDFAAWEAMARQRLERFSDDVDALRSLARMEAARGNVRAATGYYARIVEMGKPTVNDYNMLSWLELFDGNITQKGLEHGQQGNLQSRSENAPLLHTLASVYAETGKIAEAREMILKAMDQWNLDEPNSTSWYVFGRIAEQYGMTEDAVAAYKKVERPDHDWQIPNSTYQLAERRLAVIAAASPAPAKSPAKPAPAKAASTKAAN